MNISFDHQDMVDSVCILVAARENFGTVEGSEPQFVDDVAIFFTPSHGFSAEATVLGEYHRLTEQALIEAVSLYLVVYHNFEPDCILVNLLYHAEIDEFGADIIIERE